MKFPLKRAHASLVLAVIAVFLLSLFIAHLAMTLTPLAYYEQRVYSVSSFSLGGSNSSVGGEAFTGDNFVGVFLSPAPGDTNVSRDTVISVYETRPVYVYLHATPETPIAKMTKEQDLPTSEITTLYPAELLQPATTYNVSGTIMGLSVWWTFKTTVEPDQLRMERILSPNVWWIAILAATVTTSIFTVALWRRRYSKRLSESTKSER